MSCITVHRDSSVRSACESIEKNQAKEIFWYASVSADKLRALSQALNNHVARLGARNSILKSVYIECMLCYFSILNSFLCYFLDKGSDYEVLTTIINSLHPKVLEWLSIVGVMCFLISKGNNKA